MSMGVWYVESFFKEEVSICRKLEYLVVVSFNLFLGRNTAAYTHSVDAGHYVFINLSDNTVYCLPDNYIVHGM